jgi:hypothetical protein
MAGRVGHSRIIVWRSSHLEMRRYRRNRGYGRRREIPALTSNYDTAGKRPAETMADSRPLLRRGTSLRLAETSRITDKERLLSLSVYCRARFCTTAYRHIRSRLAETSAVGPDFIAAFAGPRVRSPQCRQSNKSRIDDGINRLTDAYTWPSPKLAC